MSFFLALLPATLIISQQTLTILYFLFIPLWTASQLFDTLSPLPHRDTHLIPNAPLFPCPFVQTNASSSFWKQYFGYQAAFSERPNLSITRPNGGAHWPSQDSPRHAFIHSLMLSTCNLGLSDVFNFQLDRIPSTIVWLIKRLNCKYSRQHSALFAASSCSSATNFLTSF